MAGILIEVIGEANGVSKVNIGMGINVNVPQAGADVDQPWTTLCAIKGEQLDRNRIVAQLLNQLKADTDQFVKTGLSGFQAQWDQFDYLAGKCIGVSKAGDTLTGTAKGIDEKGHLVLAVDGTLHTFSSGDTSIVK